MSIRLFGHVFSTGTAAEVLAEAEAKPHRFPRLVVTANVDHIVVLSENPAFRKAYQGAAVRTLDGTPLEYEDIAIDLDGRRARLRDGRTLRLDVAHGARWVVVAFVNPGS